MYTVKGLDTYVKSSQLKEALEIPKNQEIRLRGLAQGEYNINYVFSHPATGKKLVFRVNTGSQMHLERQIEYEYRALCLLRPSKRTPNPLFVDGSLERLGYGVMVMDFLEGRALDYRRDLDFAAECLADIHSVPLPDGSLISPENPLRAILEECHSMVETYNRSSLAHNGTRVRIARLLERGERMLQRWGDYGGYRCCVNTELNSGNFLINGKGAGNYLVDWEKPLCADPAQDLGHFLAPTTTFWKTDVILTGEEMRGFLDIYQKSTAGRYDTKGLAERVALYVPITCLRGITWSAMAWVEYQEPNRMIKNEFTFKKICDYLSDEFLDKIEQRYFY